MREGRNKRGREPRKLIKKKILIRRKEKEKLIREKK